MSRRTVVTFIVLVSISVGGLLVARALRQQTDDPAQPTPPGASTPAPSQGTPRGEVTLDTRRQQLIGVRTVSVQRTAMSPEIRATGTVTFDETRQAEINTRADGWVRELYADYTGRTIRRGEPLFTLYSPDILATQNEYLLALRGQHTGDEAQDKLRGYSDRLVAAARERLLRLDMTSEEIDQLQQSGRTSDTITFRSLVTGVIVEKAAVRGMSVMAGQMLYRVADLSTVWVEAEVYENEIAGIRTGLQASVRLQAYPDRSFAGRVSYVYPTVSEQTRTARLRITLSNPGGLLKPNMLATVTVQTPRSNALVLPADALVDTGTQQLVFVAEGDGRFIPREVRIGRRTPGEVEVLSGVKEGDQVAASATFFLDSESQLRGALQNYQPSASVAPPGGPAAPEVDLAFRTEPDPPHTGEDSFIVTVKDAAGQSIADGDVTVLLFMPAMPTMSMPAQRSETKLLSAGGGVYRGTGQVMTPGTWDVTVTVTKAGQQLATRRFSVVAK